MEVVTCQRMPIAMFMYFLAGNFEVRYVEKNGVGTSLKTERSSVKRGKVINEGWKLKT